MCSRGHLSAGVSLELVPQGTQLLLLPRELGAVRRHSVERHERECAIRLGVGLAAYRDCSVASSSSDRCSSARSR